MPASSFCGMFSASAHVNEVQLGGISSTEMKKKCGMEFETSPIGCECKWRKDTCDSTLKCWNEDHYRFRTSLKMISRCLSSFTYKIGRSNSLLRWCLQRALRLPNSRTKVKNVSLFDLHNSFYLWCCTNKLAVAGNYCSVLTSGWIY